MADDLSSNKFCTPLTVPGMDSIRRSLLIKPSQKVLGYLHNICAVIAAAGRSC